MSILMIIIVIAYLCIVSYLGFRDYKSTKSVTDYMLGGRNIHPYVMAMSYGATFISTSAIVGFGGAAGEFGLDLLWLTFLNIFIGIFIAFWVFGGVFATRAGVLVGILVSVYLAFLMEAKFGKTGTAIVARGTAIFFGLCACAFLPMYVGALWSRTITKAAAIAGMLSGAFSSLFWIVFVQEKASTALTLCQKLFGTRSLAIHMENGKEIFEHSGPLVWAFVDPLLIGLPIAIVVTVVVTLLTKKLSNEHLELCLGKK